MFAAILPIDNCLYNGTRRMESKSDTIVHIFIYYKLMIMKRDLISQIGYKTHLNDMNHNASYSATPCSTSVHDILVVHVCMYWSCYTNSRSLRVKVVFTGSSLVAHWYVQSGTSCYCRDKTTWYIVALPYIPVDNQVYNNTKKTIDIVFSRYVKNVAIRSSLKRIAFLWEKNPSFLVDSLQEGIERVEKGHYAFIMESGSAK